MLDKKREDQLIDILTELITIPSVSLEEGRLVQRTKEIMEEIGFDEVQIDEVGNVIGKIRGENPENPPLLFDGHIDTVGISTTDWDFDPFGAEKENDRIYGRGTSDMKGSIAAAISAASFLKQDGYKPNRDIYICCSVCEEIVEGAALEPVIERLKPGVVIIGEATNLNLAVGQRGRAEIIVETRGVPTHSSRPDLGVNAIKLMHEFFTQAEKCPLPEDERLGKTIMEVTDIKSFPYPGLSVVPDRCRVTYDRRLVIGETEQKILEPLLEAVRTLKGKSEKFSADVYLSETEFTTHTGYKIKAKKFSPAWIENDSELTDKCLRFINSAGINSEFSTYKFCTNGSSSAGKYKIPTVGFGVGEEEQAHRVNESISLTDLNLGTKGYMALFTILSF